jgi:hypothetical protein
MYDFYGVNTESGTKAFLLTQKYCCLLAKTDYIKCFFKENRQFCFLKIVENRRKLAKIAENWRKSPKIGNVTSTSANDATLSPCLIKTRALQFGATDNIFHLINF